MPSGSAPSSEADQRAALIVEVAMRGSAGTGDETHLVKTRADDAGLLRLRNRVADLPRAGGGRSTRAVASTSTLAWPIRLLRQRRQIFHVNGRELRERLASSTACFSAASLTSVVAAEPRRLPIQHGDARA